MSTSDNQAFNVGTKVCSLSPALAPPSLLPNPPPLCLYLSLRLHLVPACKKSGTDGWSSRFLGLIKSAHGQPCFFFLTFHISGTACLENGPSGTAKPIPSADPLGLLLVKAVSNTMVCSNVVLQLKSKCPVAVLHVSDQLVPNSLTFLLGFLAAGEHTSELQFRKDVAVLECIRVCSMLVLREA